MLVRTALPELTLGPICLDDLPALVTHANDVEVARGLTDVFPHPYRLEDGLLWVEHNLKAPLQTSWVIAEQEQFVGMIGYQRAGDIRRLSADLGYWLGRRVWGRGYATAAATALVRHLFDTTDLVRLQAYVFDWNTASARVLEKAGFVCEARLRKAMVKHGQIMDGLLYACVRD
jgi:ribosomal-protein-alanine N-acetyltransferase